LERRRKLDSLKSCVTYSVQATGLVIWECL
jgi:hypothetical protein